MSSKQIVALAACLVAAMPGLAAESPAGRHRLVAGDLAVEIATNTPHLEARYGPRFDRSAVVVSARRSDTEFLDSRGLCDEFGLRGTGVLGYDEADVGTGEFIKIGVGVLRRDDPGAYSFVRRWPVLESVSAVVDGTSDQVTVTHEGGRHGFAYRLKKTYRVREDGSLVIAYLLENTGARSFEFEHYNHHFFAFAGQPSDPRYAVRPGFPFAEAGNDHWRREAGGLRLVAAAPERGGAALAFDMDVPASGNRVTLEHANGQAVTMTGDYPVTRFALWSIKTAICPELFYRRTIAAGDQAAWRMTYQFSVKPDAG